MINLDHVNIKLWHNLIIKDVPVIVVICISFFSGILYHWLFTFPILLKLKNQIFKLQKELKNISKNQ
ncbi:LapA family protein [Candidatus Kinetoplastibacterium sorsogonicusi]|uniref:LapA family protein n=1 Tax=Candidatus Kinetoplastidibacterium kentomonadis TaxID=1576550 RepID=UPI0013751595|nr:LapA family protein [Candidatus Kinetoplastibacterium sorsogonicusi]